MARLIPAPVAGKPPVFDPFAACGNDGENVLPGVGVNTHDKRVGIRNDSHSGSGTFLILRIWSGRYGPVPVRVEVTSEQHCDEPRPVRSGQSSDQVTEVGRAGAGRPTQQTDMSITGHPERAGAKRLMSHDRQGGTACTYSASQSQTSHPNPHRRLKRGSRSGCENSRAWPFRLFRNSAQWMVPASIFMAGLPRRRNFAWSDTAGARLGLPVFDGLVH